MPRIPGIGETLHGSDYRTGFSGKGANQTVAVKRLLSSDSTRNGGGGSVSVAIVTRVGDDSDGRATLENFKDNGVLTDFVSVETGRPTGVAPITVDMETGDNSIIVVMGVVIVLRALVRARECRHGVCHGPSCSVLQHIKQQSDMCNQNPRSS